LEPEELSLVKNYKGNKLSLAVRLKVFGHLLSHNFPLSEVPQKVVDYVASQLQEKPVTLSETKAQRYKQIKLIRRYTGFSPFTKEEQEKLETWLSNEAEKQCHLVDVSNRVSIQAFDVYVDGSRVLPGKVYINALPMSGVKTPEASNLVFIGKRWTIAFQVEFDRPVLQVYGRGFIGWRVNAENLPWCANILRWFATFGRFVFRRAIRSGRKFSTGGAKVLPSILVSTFFSIKVNLGTGNLCEHRWTNHCKSQRHTENHNNLWTNHDMFYPLFLFKPI